MPLLLPPELWDAIHDCLQSKRDVLNVVRVCHAWYARVASRIYRSVTVDIVSSASEHYHYPAAPRLSASFLSRLIEWDSPCLALIRTLRYDFTFDQFWAGGSRPSHLAKVPFPPKLQISTLILDRLGGWEHNNEILLLTTNFAHITSLELARTRYFDNAPAFASAMSKFPLLRSLAFSGLFIELTDRQYYIQAPNITPPLFSHPCDLAVNTPERLTWLAILDWALLDLSRIGTISLGDTDCIDLLCKRLPSHPELASRVIEISAYYIPNRREEWPLLDSCLSRFPQLRALRVHTLTNKVTSGAGDAYEHGVDLFGKLVKVAKRQLVLSPAMREVFLEIPTELFTASHAQEAIARMDAELSRLDALSRVRIHMAYYRYPDTRSAGPSPHRAIQPEAPLADADPTLEDYHIFSTSVPGLGYLMSWMG